jgi:hypothetical protein
LRDDPKPREAKRNSLALSPGMAVAAFSLVHHYAIPELTQKWNLEEYD